MTFVKGSGQTFFFYYWARIVNIFDSLSEKVIIQAKKPQAYHI